jgi:hypothetical protein
LNADVGVELKVVITPSGTGAGMHLGVCQESQEISFCAQWCVNKKKCIMYFAFIAFKL